ncbi:DUF502 domain-containing protein [Thermospira aquatica]|uniref:DUF502 domain-containing protein n=1 Tax=Thermospira aquatica TaxID=2828656 RepID=A0AAX3BB27_9SPIR|nr:DUF502 domain-containing protein [Thermospira aquatica]URA09440.1 DUF502 domain-containing protein [Thermospira aquatica]
MKRIWRFLRNRFIEGLLVVGPVMAVFFLLKWLFLAIHRFMEMIVQLLGLQAFIRFNLWILELLTFLALVVFLVILSVLLQTFLGKWFRGILEQFFESFPGIGTIYGALKQISGFLVQEREKETSASVVLVDFPGERTKSLGFLMGTMKQDVLPESFDGKILHVVYIPTAPFPTTGYLLMLEETHIEKTNLAWEEAVRIVFSGGILDADRKD